MIKILLCCICIVLSFHCPGQIFSIEEVKKNKSEVLVVSGGGARGAFAAGLLQALHESNYQREYKYAVGTSTGALMVPLVLTEKYPELKVHYTTTRQKDIFSRSPFNKRTGKVKFTSFFYLFCKSLGKTKPLLKLIRKNYSYQDHQSLIQQGKEFSVMCVGLNSNNIRAFANTGFDQDYTNFTSLIWASANQPVFMPYFEYEGEKYVDGGLKENVAITRALDYALQTESKCIDVMVNSTSEFYETVQWDKKSAYQVLFRTIDIFSNDVRENDITRAQFDAKYRGIKLIFYFMDTTAYDMVPKSLWFNPTDMERLWEYSYQSLKAALQGDALFTSKGQQLSTEQPAKNVLVFEINEHGECVPVEQ